MVERYGLIFRLLFSDGKISILTTTSPKREGMFTNESLCDKFFNSHFLVKQEQELDARHESWQEGVCMRVFSTLMSWSNEDKSCMKVYESWQARVCMRVFLTLMSWSNDFKSCMRVDESWQTRVCMRVFSCNSHVLVKREQELMRVDKREFLSARARKKNSN